MSLFVQGPPKPSEPVDVPLRNTDHVNSKSGSRLSTSAPSQWARRDVTQVESPGLQPQRSLPGLTPRPRLDSDVGADLSAAGSQTLLDEVDGGEDPDMDDFDRLRNIRDQHRREKYLQKLLARSISAQQAAGSIELIDNDLLLEDLLMQSAANNKEDKSTEEIP